MRTLLSLLALLGTPSLADLTVTGLPSCPCVEWANLDNYRPKGQRGTGYDYPLNYGNLECKAHDLGLPPFCDGNAAPAWCAQKWCYVDKNACSNAVPYRSKLFENSDAYYSYQTCGESNEFSQWNSGSSGSTSSQVTELLDVVQGYLWSTRNRVETEYSNLRQSDGCEFANQCPCLECSQQSSLWNRKTDFGNVGVNAKDASFQCLSRPVTQSYMNVAAKEGGIRREVLTNAWAISTFRITKAEAIWDGPQWSGALLQAMTPGFDRMDASVCPARGATRVTGRGWTRTAGVERSLVRWWKDFADIILFNGGIVAEYAPQGLVSMTDSERKNMQAWLNNHNWDSSQQHGAQPLNAAFSVISKSVSSGSTSMCQKAILFLTDGEADFSESDFSSTRAQAEQHSVAIFTYALGSGADTTITKRLACENKGIFYQLADGVDLSKVMSRYYEYFASGVEICTPSFTHYKDSVTGAELWPSCLPAYDASSGVRGLLGVSCFDLNVMVDPETLKSESYWDDFVCKVSDLTKQCRQLDLNDCTLERLRRAVGPESTCSTGSTDSTSNATCPCADPACQDNEERRTEQEGCGRKVGDDCSGAMESWGYTAGGQQDILVQCKRSCGVCPQISPCPTEGPCQTLGCKAGWAHPHSILTV
eukprot:g30891.t1